MTNQDGCEDNCSQILRARSLTQKNKPIAESIKIIVVYAVNIFIIYMYFRL